MLQFVNMVAEFQRGSQFQTQVLHDHITLQQQEGIAINLLVEQDQKKENPEDGQINQTVAIVNTESGDEVRERGFTQAHILLVPRQYLLLQNKLKQTNTMCSSSHNLPEVIWDTGSFTSLLPW